MNRMRLINTDKKEYATGTKKKIRTIIGIAKEKDLIQLAKDSGVKIGIRPATQVKRSYDYFADLVNDRIIEARKDEKIKQTQKRQAIKKLGSSLGRNTDAMYSRVKKIKTTGKISIVGKDGTIYYETLLDRNNKQTLAQQFRDFIMFDSEKTLLDMLDDQTAEVYIIEGQTPKSKKVNQSFKEGSVNCLLQPIKLWIEDKIETATSKGTKDTYRVRLNKVNKLNSKYFDSGIDADNVAIVSNELQIDINISLPFQDNYISVKSQKKPRRTFNYRNTKLNHVDYDVLAYEDNVEELSIDELANKFDELINTDKYFTYKRSMTRITEIKTIDTIYRMPNTYAEVVRDFEIDNNLIECKLCDIKNKDISTFVRQGCHLNVAIDGVGWDTDLKYGIDYEHIDQKRAYSQYKMCKYYKGFLGKITDFRKCNKIVDVGYYRIENITFGITLPNGKDSNSGDNSMRSSGTQSRLGALNDWLKIWNNYNVYPSCELEYLMDNGVSFDIIEGCWGSVIDFEFNDALMNGKTEDGIRYYCKYVGSMMCGNLTNSFYIRGEDDFIENVVSEVSCDNAFRYGNEVRIVYNKSSNYHSTHIAGFITSYMRLNMMEQLEQFEPSDIYRIACDGIYFKKPRFPNLPFPLVLKNCFRIEEKQPTKNEAGDCYISNNQDVDYINGKRLEVGEWREHNRVEVHTGCGGAGKTHYNLIDKGFINPCFYAPSYKLARSKEVEYNCNVSVSQKLTSNDPEMIGLVSRYNSVLIIDEVSMMSNEDKDLIIENYPTCKIIFCGDIGYQLPCFQNDEQRKNGFIPTPFCIDGMIVKNHNKNYRVECSKLSGILSKCREMMANKLQIKSYVSGLWPRAPIMEAGLKEGKETLVSYNYKEDIIISATHKGKDFYTDKFKHLEKYYITKSDRVYGRGEITLVKPETECYEIRHAYTCHSIQGETAKGKIFIDTNKMYENTMIYTAISRAKRFNQIILTGN